MSAEEGKVPDPEEFPTGPDILAQSQFKIPCMSPTQNTLKVGFKLYPFLHISTRMIHCDEISDVMA